MGTKNQTYLRLFFKNRQYMSKESIFLPVWLLAFRYSRRRAGAISRLYMQIQQAGVPKISGVPKINDFWHNGLVIKSIC